jgi:tRNA (adenine57-N1/adenine58-N1)-methyltransferase
LIASLLDIHPRAPQTEQQIGKSEDKPEDKLEIFEAGTGHGVLTLHLAKAIHAANTAAPPIPNDLTPPEVKEAYDIWRANRRAVVHTLDRSATYSQHAQKIVKNFRHAIYYPHVDFYVGTIDGFLSKRWAEKDEPFLDHAILDVPNTDEYIEIIGNCLKPNGLLATWCPSITQINKCVLLVKEKKLPFYLERVLEMGPGAGVGGKEWDVRVAKVRAIPSEPEEELSSQDIGIQSALPAEEEVERHIREDGVQDNIASSSLPDIAAHIGTVEVESKEKDETTNPDDGYTWEMVCRPKVGIRMEGGGFVGLWRRMKSVYDR